MSVNFQQGHTCTCNSRRYYIRRHSQ